MSSVTIYQFMLFFAILQFWISGILTCGYTIPNVSQIVTGINIPPPPIGYQPRSVTANNLRIFLEYMDSFYNYPGAADIKTNIMEPARLSLQSMIKVINPTSGVLRVDRQCVSSQYRINSNKEVGCTSGCVPATTCVGFTVPDKYLNKCKVIDSSGQLVTSGLEGSGEVNVDIVLLVSVSTCPDGVIAFANSCFQESQLDRPILGVLNLCSGMVVANTYNRVNIITVKHEMVHALGFAVDKYAFYRNPDGTPIVPRDAFGRPNVGISTYGFYMWNEKIIVQVNRTRSSVSTNYIVPFYALVLPNIVAVAQQHFNCPSITSVELEDYGTIGSAFSHFDEYVLYNEFMNAENNGWNQRFSKFTLALLKDTGWYDVDYTKADDLDYGKSAGCVLPLNGCYAYMQSQRATNNPIDPFCDIGYGRILQCHPSRQYYQYCKIVPDAGRPPKFQYFTSVQGITSSNPSYYGGTSPYSEYCPMKSVPADRNDGLNSDCTDINNNGKSNIYTPIASSYGPNAICFDTTMSGQPIYGATCLNYSYSGNNINYSLCLGDQRVLCANNYVQSFVPYYGVSGTISCVNPSLLKPNSLVSTCQQSTAYSSPKMGSALQYETWMIIWLIFFRIFI